MFLGDGGTLITPAEYKGEGVHTWACTQVVWRVTTKVGRVAVLPFSSGIYPQLSPTCKSVLLF